MAMKYFAFTVYEQAGEFEFSTRWVAAGNDATENDIEASMEKTIFASVDPELYPCCGDVQEITREDHPRRKKSRMPEAAAAQVLGLLEIDQPGLPLRSSLSAKIR